MPESTELVNESSVGGLSMAEMREFGCPSESLKSFRC